MDILHLQCVCGWVGVWGGGDCCRLHFRFPHARQKCPRKHRVHGFHCSGEHAETEGRCFLSKQERSPLGLEGAQLQETNLYQLSNNLVTFPNTQQRAHKGEQLQKRNHLHQLSNNLVTFHNTQQQLHIQYNTHFCSRGDDSFGSIDVQPPL